MTTKRTALDRRRNGGGVNDRALDLFESILHAWAECTCTPPTGKGEFYWSKENYWARDCPACQHADALDDELRAELKLRPWEWPTLCAGCDDDADHDADQRYNDLMAALIARKKRLLSAYLVRHPRQRRDGVAYRQSSAKDDRWEAAPLAEGMTAERGWLTLADLS